MNYVLTETIAVDQLLSLCTPLYVFLLAAGSLTFHCLEGDKNIE
jgi:hypothetical protein